MQVELVQIRFRIPYAQSLKNKRRTFKSLYDKIHVRYNVSLAETNFQNDFHFAEISFVHIAQYRAQLDQRTEKVLKIFENESEIEIYDIEREYL